MRFFQFLLYCRQPILIRHVLHLKSDNLRLQFQIFLLQCDYILFEYRLRRAERILKRRRGTTVAQ